MIPTPEQAEKRIEEEPGESTYFRAKWMFNNCDTLEEIEERTEKARERIEKLKEKGFEVVENSNDDYIYISKE